MRNGAPGRPQAPPITSGLDDHRVEDRVQLRAIRGRRPGEVLEDDDESGAVNVEDVGLPAVGRPLRVDLAVPEPPHALVTPYSRGGAIDLGERLGRTDDVDALAGVAPDLHVDRVRGLVRGLLLERLDK